MSKYISFADAHRFFGGDFVSIPMHIIDENEPELLYCSDEENEIVNIKITNLMDDDVKYLTDLFPSLRFKYSNYLEGWILLIDHCGTPWQSVPVEVNEDSYMYDKSNSRMNFIK